MMARMEGSAVERRCRLAWVRGSSRVIGWKRSFWDGRVRREVYGGLCLFFLLVRKRVCRKEAVG